MKTRTCLIILFLAFGLMITGAVITNTLESNGTLEALGPNGRILVNVVPFILFLIIGFVVVPLFLRLFIKLQIKAGNGEFFLVKWLQSHERKIVYGVWAIYLIGLMISLPSAIKEGFFN